MRFRENITANFFKQTLNQSEDLQTFLRTSDHYLGDRIKNTCPKSKELAQELANKMKTFASIIYRQIHKVFSDKMFLRQNWIPRSFCDTHM